MQSDPIASYSDLTAEGQLYVRHGDFRRAIDNFEQAVRLAHDLDDSALLVKALCNLSTARLAAGDIKEAEKGLREILLRTRDPQTVFVTSSNLASALRRQGRHDRALMYARRALRACEGLDNPSWKATIHNLIANIYMNMSYLDDAVAEYRHALSISEKSGLGTEWPIDQIKENLGYCLLLKKRYRQGIAIILEALQIALKNGSSRCVGECYQDLAFAYMQIKEYPQSIEHGEMALELALKHDYKDIQKNCYYLLGETHLLMGEDAKSDKYFDRLQEYYPHLPVLKEFLRTFDVSNILNLKNPV